MVLDRIAPTRRPDGRVGGYQKWRSLLFLHWPVPVDLLRSLVPSSLEIDQFDGVAYAGVVPFAMEQVRPNWLPAALAFNFLETNVRTYVHRNGQPGVYFFSLEAASALAVWAAREFWGLPYHYAKMSFERESNGAGRVGRDPRAGNAQLGDFDEGDTLCYRSARRGSDASHHVRYRIGERIDTTSPDSLEFFFLERYLLYVQRKNKTYMGQVHHSPYPAHLAHVLDVDDHLLQAAGIDTLGQAPEFAHFSPGVDVEIFDLKVAK
jgi:uncharacterized protein YqjF (DUF2071 family)